MVSTADDIVRPEQFEREDEPSGLKGADILERLKAQRQQRAEQGAVPKDVCTEGRVSLGNLAMDRMIERIRADRRSEQDSLAKEASRREEEADGRRSLPDDRARKSNGHGRRQVPRKARVPRR